MVGVALLNQLWLAVSMKGVGAVRSTKYCLVSFAVVLRYCELLSMHRTVQLWLPSIIPSRVMLFPALFCRADSLIVLLRMPSNTRLQLASPVSSETLK